MFIYMHIYALYIYALHIYMLIYKPLYKYKAGISLLLPALASTRVIDSGSLIYSHHCNLSSSRGRHLSLYVVVPTFSSQYCKDFNYLKISIHNTKTKIKLLTKIKIVIVFFPLPRINK